MGSTSDGHGVRKTGAAIAVAALILGGAGWWIGHRPAHTPVPPPAPAAAVPCVSVAGTADPACAASGGALTPTPTGTVPTEVPMVEGTVTPAHHSSAHPRGPWHCQQLDWAHNRGAWCRGDGGLWHGGRIVRPSVALRD